MAIQYVGGRTQAIAGAASGTVNVALTGLTGGIASQPAAGDLVLIGYSSGKTADQVIAIGGYAEIAELYADGSGADANLEAAYKFMGATPDTVAAVPNSGSTADAVAVSARVYRGVDPANPFDVARVTATGTGTTNPNPAQIAPATAGAALVAFGAGAIAGTGLAFASSDLTGFHSLNSPDNNDATIGAGHKLDASGAFDAAAWTGGVSGAGNSWSAIVLALRPLQAVTHQGAMAGSAAGNFAAAGRRQLAGAFAASAAGNFAAAAVKRLGGAIASSAAGSFAASATRRAAGKLAASAAGSASLLARQLARGRVAVTAAGNFAAQGARSTAAALTAAGSSVTALVGRLRGAGAMTAQAESDFGASGSVAGGSRPAPPSRIGIQIGLGL